MPLRSRPFCASLKELTVATAKPEAHRHPGGLLHLLVSRDAGGTRSAATPTIFMFVSACLRQSQGTLRSATPEWRLTRKVFRAKHAVVRLNEAKPKAAHRALFQCV